MSNNKELFERTKVSKAVWTLALPTMLAMLVTIIYNVADTFFIGQTGDTNKVAAISLAMPVFMIMMSLGSLFGTGGSTTISRNLGAGNLTRVKKISAFSLYSSLLAGLVLGVLLIGFATPIARLLGGSPDTTDHVVSYLVYIAIGAPFIIMSNAFGSIVRSDGNAKAALLGMLIGTITNIILDPILILTFDFGVSGAAIATVIGNIAASIYYVAYIQRNSDTVMSLSIRDFAVKDGIAKDVVSIGIPGSLSGLFMSIAIMFLNVYLVNYGDNAVAAMGIATKGNQIPAMLFGGFAMGSQPLLGYAYGANNKERLTELIRYCITVSILMGLVMTSVLLVFAPQVIRFFIDDPSIVTLGTRMLRAMMATNSFLCLYFMSMNILQAMGKASGALVLTVARQGLVFVPVLIAGNALFGLTGVIWAQPVADVFSMILGLYLLRRSLHAMDDVNKGIIAPQTELFASAA